MASGCWTWAGTWPGRPARCGWATWAPTSSRSRTPGEGDHGREAGPPFFNGESAFFLSANRNKRSVALDFKVPEGQELFRKLADTADVVIENFRPGVMDALNIGYQTMAARNPGIIYCSISGFGIDGPYANRPGLDQIMQGFSGLMSITGFEGGEPVRSGIPIADLLTGLFGSYGVLAALQARERTGRGQEVNTSLLESMVGMLGFQGVRYLNGAGSPPPAGNHHPINAPYGVFKARDGYLTIGATGDKRWPALCRLIDAPELLEDERFATNGGRYANRLLLAELISAKMQAKSADEWEALLNEAGIPCGPIYSIEQALEHPQTQHREMVVEREHPTAGPDPAAGPAGQVQRHAGRHPPRAAAARPAYRGSVARDWRIQRRLERAGRVRRGSAGRV